MDPENDRSNSSRGRSNSSGFLCLQDQIAQLDFHSFHILTFLWLVSIGYRGIRSLGRTSARGRRLSGGADFIAIHPCSDSVRVAVTLKHWRTPVQRRSVDELWGYLLRHDIPLGLIVSNQRFSGKAQTAILEFPGRPIQLVTPADLAKSMVGSGLGTHAGQGEPVFDKTFLRTLDRLRFASSPNKGRNLDGLENRRSLEAWHSADAEHQRPSKVCSWVFLAWLLIVLLIYLGVSR